MCNGSIRLMRKSDGRYILLPLRSLVAGDVASLALSTLHSADNGQVYTPLPYYTYVCSLHFTYTPTYFV